MRSHRFLSFSLLTICFAVLFAASPTKAQCGPNIIGFGEIGVVANNPFHAEVTHTTTSHTDVEPALRLNYPEWVARDSQGRIRTERIAGEFKRDTGPDAGSNVEAHLIRICDPIAQTMTQIDTATLTAKIIHSRPSAPSAGTLKSSTTPRSFCSTRMSSSRQASRFNVEDLGEQTIEGVEAHGERIILPKLGATVGEDPPNGESTSERWCSDSLSALVLTITGNTKTGVKSSLAMQKIERTEPDPALFQIPEGYTVTESVAEPRERRAPSAAPTVQP
jgi:hypothetical protein